MLVQTWGVYSGTTRNQRWTNYTNWILIWTNWIYMHKRGWQMLLKGQFAMLLRNHTTLVPSFSLLICLKMPPLPCLYISLYNCWSLLPLAVSTAVCGWGWTGQPHAARWSEGHRSRICWPPRRRASCDDWLPRTPTTGGHSGWRRRLDSMSAPYRWAGEGVGLVVDVGDVPLVS